MPKFRAFLLGVTDYDKSIPSLKFVRSDLASLAIALKAAGYQVKVHPETRPGLNTIRQEVRGFIRSANPGDINLILLSGHGIHHAANDYIVPGDVVIDADFSPADACVPVNYWDPLIADSRIDNLVIFIDACREGISTTATMTVDIKPWSKGKVASYLTKKVAYIYSCQAGQTAQFVPDRNDSFSIFSRALQLIAADAAGPATLKGLTSALNMTIHELAHRHRRRGQEIHVKSGATEVNQDEFVLFPQKQGNGFDGDKPYLPPLPPWRPWWKPNRASVAIVVGILTTATAAVVPQIIPAPRPPEPVNLVFDTWGEQGGDMHGYDELLAEYSKRHPHITIEQRWAKSLDEHADNVQARLRAGEGLGDLVAAEEAIMGDMYVRPADWADLRPLVGDLSKDYVASRWDGGQTPDGKRLLGLPTDVQTMAMCYRRDLLTAAGFPAEREAVAKLWPTWGAFVATAKQYKERTGLPMLDTVRHVFSAMALQGGEPLFYDRSNVFAADRSNSVRSAWDSAVQMVGAGITANAPTYTGNWQQGLSSNAFAVTLCPNWILQTLADQSGPGLKGQWDLTALPGGGAHWGGSWLSVPAQSKHQTEAAALAVFLTSREGQLAAFAKQPGVFPSHLGAIQSDQVKNLTNPYFNNAPTARIYTAAAVTTRPVFLGCRYTSIMEKAFVHAIGQVENGGGNIAQLWEQAQSDARRFRC